MALRERTDPPSLDWLLPWCARRLPGRAARRARFPEALHRCFGDDRLPFTVVKVAGTNGKGSVAAMLSAAAHRDGAGVGLFTSPHLERFTERIRIDERDVTSVDMEATLRSMKPLLLELEHDGGLALVPSFFEVLLLAALQMFARRAVDLAILEAGVGGSNDVVGLLDGPVAAVTSVALDHGEVLGASATAVAVDKAGIASPGSRLVIGPSVRGETLEAVEAGARRRGARPIRVDAGGLETRSAGSAGHRVLVPAAEGLGEFGLPLAGSHQVDNLAVVHGMIGELADVGVIDDTRCITGVEQTRWPGRLETVPGSPPWLIDAAHNPSGFEALVDAVPGLTGGREPVVLYGASEGHAFAECLRLLPSLSRRVHLVEGFHRSVPVAELQERLPASVEVGGAHTSIEEAVAALRGHDATDGESVLAIGSIYLIGRLRRLLVRRVPAG